MGKGDPCEDKEFLIDSNGDPIEDLEIPQVSLRISTKPQDQEHEVIISSTQEASTSFQSELNEFNPKETFQPCSVPNNEDEESGGVPKSKFRRLINGIGLGRKLRRFWTSQHRLIISSLLSISGSTGTLLFVPIYFEKVAEGEGWMGDAFSACLAAFSMTTILSLFTCIFLEICRAKGVYLIGSGSLSLLRPIMGWQSIAKVGFCLGLSSVTISYAWEDDKVPCNCQDSLLGLIVFFAIITHAVCRWKSIGVKRILAMSSVAIGVLLGVDYQIIDHHRCRGYYHKGFYDESVEWSLKVNMVWTMAFIVSIWLATVAVFFMEAGVPIPLIKRSRFQDLGYNAVKLQVIRERGAERANPSSDNNNEIFQNYCYSPYSKFHLGVVPNIVLWFSVSTLLIVLSLFWTEFIPGFGKGLVTFDKLLERIGSSFHTCLTSTSSWALFASMFIFTHAFTYLTILTRSPIISISISSICFPLIGMWWSMFQIRKSFFVLMPIITGELVCACLGFVVALVGCYYLIKFELYKQNAPQSSVKVLRR